MTKRNVNYLKPPRFAHYFTISEVCEKTGKQPKWIKELEKAGRIPRAMRTKRGRVQVRLWSPEQLEEIQEILATHRVGRPSNG